METQPIRKKIHPAMFFADKTKRTITPIFWPRLLLVQIRQTTLAITELMQSSNNFLRDSFQLIKIALDALGWALHGLRLVMIITQGLAEYLFGEKNNSLKTRLMRFLRNHCKEIGNDHLWITKTLVHSSNLFTATLFLFLEVVWENYCISREYEHLNKLSRDHEEALRAPYLMPEAFADLTKKQAKIKQLLAQANKKATCNHIAIFCTSVLFLAKNIIIPLLFPAIASNPIFPIVFACLALLLIIVRRLVTLYLSQKKELDPPKKLGERNWINHVFSISFFKKVDELQTIEKITNEKTLQQ